MDNHIHELSTVIMSLFILNLNLNLEDWYLAVASLYHSIPAQLPTLSESFLFNCFYKTPMYKLFDPHNLLLLPNWKYRVSFTFPSFYGIQICQKFAMKETMKNAQL